MYLDIDASHMPPTVQLRDPDDFTSFHAVLAIPTHFWVDPAVLADLAGRGENESWQRQLADMIAYADSKGWLDEQGRLRAHVQSRRT